MFRLVRSGKGDARLVNESRQFAETCRSALPLAASAWKVDTVDGGKGDT